MSKSKEQCINIISRRFDNIENKNDFKALLIALEESITEICGSEIGLFSILDGENEKLRILNKNIDLTTSFNNTVMENILLSKKGFFDNAIVRHKKYRQEIDNPLNIKIKSTIVVPILDEQKEKVLGFLSASNSIGNNKEFERYETRSLGLLDNYSRKIIRLIKSQKNEKIPFKKEEKESKELKKNNKILNKENLEFSDNGFSIKISIEERNSELEKELTIQLEKIEKLEKELSLKNESKTLSSNKDLISINEILEKDSNHSTRDGLGYVLDFLTNEVTYLANEEHKIYLFLEIIKNSLHNKEQLNFIERELNNSHLINNLANELYTREKMPLLFEEFNPFKIFSSVGNLYYRSFSDENIIYNIFIEPKLSTVMISDVGKVKSLIVHLMNNVYGFISKGGVVDFLVFSSKEEDILNIEIKAFMPNEVRNIKNLFKTKLTTHNIITNDKGLGLSVCSNLINILGGKLKLSREGSDEHSFMASIPIKIIPEKKQKEFISKIPIKIAVLLSEEDNYAYQNLKRYFLAFNILESDILVFQNYKKMDNIKFSHLFCFESMLSEKIDKGNFSSITILKYKEKKLDHDALNNISVNELTINAYYGMALQQILFPHLPVEEIENGTIIIEDSFLRKFNNMVSRLKFA